MRRGHPVVFSSSWHIHVPILLQSVGWKIPCNRLTCQPKLAHDRSLCPFISGTRVRFCGELFFFFFPSSFFSLPFLALDLHFFFSPLFLSSSNFFLPFPFLFFFLLFFSHSFSFFFTSCFPLSAAFLSLFPPFILFS